MKQPIAVGIDIGTTHTRVVIAEKTAAGLPRILGSAVVETKGVRHGYVVAKDDVTETLKRAINLVEKETGHKVRAASLAIGGVGLGAEYATGSCIISRADSIIGKFDIDKAIADAETKIELKNKVVIQAFPTVFRVDGAELPTRPEGTQGTKLEVKTLFVTCFQQHLDDMISAVNAAGVKVVGFTATPIITQELLLTDLQRNFGCVVVDIGAETVSVAVFENNALSTLHVFAIGGADITKDIALGLRVTPEEAENIKNGVISFQSVPKKKLDEIIDARVSDIFELIDKYLKKIGRSGLLPAGAIITGGGSHIASIESIAKQMLKIPVRLGHVDLPSAKGPIKDQRLLIAYAALAETLFQTDARDHQSGPENHEGFLATIKNFFKQLMP